MPSDLEKLQGTWTIAAPGFAQSQIILRKTKFKSDSMGATYEGEIEIDETRKPKTFDLIFTSGPEKGNRNLGIYKLAGDTWTICLATRGDRRPRKFLAAPDDGVALETFTRGTEVKTRSIPKAKAPAADTLGAGPPTLIEGEWQMVSAVFNGAPMDESMVHWCKRITNGNLTTVMAGPQVMLKASFRLSPMKESMGGIDYMNLAGSAKGKAQCGIYDLHAGLLRICMAPPGAERPTEFASKQGDGRSFTTWRQGEGTT